MQEPEPVTSLEIHVPNITNAPHTLQTKPNHTNDATREGYQPSQGSKARVPNKEQRADVEESAETGEKMKQQPPLVNSMTQIGPFEHFDKCEAKLYSKKRHKTVAVLHCNHDRDDMNNSTIRSSRRPGFSGHALASKHNTVRRFWLPLRLKKAEHCCSASLPPETNQPALGDKTSSCSGDKRSLVPRQDRSGSRRTVTSRS